MKARHVIAAAAISVAGVGAGLATPAFASAPGPNGHNDFGLCQAYPSGSSTGQSHKQSAPPFAALQNAAASAHETVAQFCAANGSTPGS
ncbi:MAG: hypothetical protein ACYCUF_08760 [Acidimicrobiales bacterium]|jgi:hypothetical protein|nr:hypothetical protein [Actinomycetota bacterium]